MIKLYHYLSSSTRFSLLVYVQVVMYFLLHISSSRSKHATLDALEEDSSNSRRRERRDKGSGRSDRPGSSNSGVAGGAGGGDGPSLKYSPDKTRSRREGSMTGSYDHKRHKEEEEFKSEMGVGHKRKRELQEDPMFPPEAKKARHRDHSRESDHRHHSLSSSNSNKEAERYHCNPVPSSSSGSGKEADRYHGGSLERKRRQESSTAMADSSRKRTIRSQTPEPPGSGGRGKAGVTSKMLYKHGKELNKRVSVTEGTSEHSRSEGGGAGKSRSLDWAAVRSFTDKANSKIQRVHTSVLDRFKPGVILGTVPVSPSLAGPDCYLQVREAILRDGGEDTNLWGTVQQGEEEDQEMQLQGKEAVEGEEQGVILGGGTLESQQQEVREEAHRNLNWDKVAGECLLSCRQALTASDDYAIRRLLRKYHRVS